MLLLALAAGSSSCQSLSAQDTREIVADVAEFLGRSDPGRHVRKLNDLHDFTSFAHRPDLPPTTDACLQEVRTLGASGYGEWREVALATYLVTRVAVEDSAALNRGEAVRALERLGAMVVEAEDPPAEAADESSATRAMKRLPEIHDRGTGRHVPPATAGECREVLGTLGDYRSVFRPEAPEAEVRMNLRILRGLLFVVVGETGTGDEHGPGPVRDAADRAVVNLAAQAVRLSLAASVRFDPQPPVRAAAARACGALGSADLAAALGQAFAREESTGVRREIVHALARACAKAGPAREPAVPVLLVALEDGDESVAANARHALKEVSGKDLGARAAPWVAWWAQERGGGGR